MANGYWDVLSCTGTYASGTFYGEGGDETYTGSYVYLVNIMDVLVSGTCWEIHTGIAEVDDPVCQIQAYEGQWFIKENENNLFVADIELMPLRRNSQHIKYSDYLNVATEFPHHHRAPSTLNGDTELIYTSSNSRLYGTVLFNNYLFSLNWDDNTIVRVDLTTGDSISQPAGGNGYAFSVIDNNWVVIDEYNAWSRLNMVTGEKVSIGGVPYSSYYYPRWAVIKDVLCVGQMYDYDIYPPNPSYIKRKHTNAMFNIWTGETLYQRTTKRLPADASVIQSVPSVVANRDFFYVTPKTSENGGTWPSVVGPEPSIIWRLRTAPEVYGGGSGPFDDPDSFTYSATPAYLYYDPDARSGDLQVIDIAYNPFNQMIYIIGLYYPGSGGSTHGVILMMSPENMSYVSIYDEIIESGSINLPFRFYPGLNELYVFVKKSANGGTFYNVRTWTPVATTYFGDFDAYYDCASVVDVNNRLWYMGVGFINDATHLYALNMETGIIDYDLAVGIDLPWGDQYYYPTDMQYRQVIPQNDCIIVFKHNTYQYAYQGRPAIYDRSTQIYKVT